MGARRKKKKPREPGFLTLGILLFVITRVIIAVTVNIYDMLLIMVVTKLFMALVAPFVIMALLARNSK